METWEMPNGLKWFLAFLGAAVAVAALYLFRSVFIPVTIALLIYILIAPLFHWLTKKVPVLLASVFILFLFLLFFFFGGLYLSSSINAFVGKIDIYKQGYSKVYNKYASKIGFIWEKLNEEPLDWDGVVHAFRHPHPAADGESDAGAGHARSGSHAALAQTEGERLPEQTPFTMHSLFSKINLKELMKSLVSASSSLFGFVGDLILVILFLLFILLESKAYQKKQEKLLVGERGEKIKRVIGDINSQVVRYINVKVWISLLTAVLVAVAATLIGLDFPSVWAVLAFVLNFIPSIGSIVFFALETLFSVAQFLPDEQWWRVIAVALSTGAIEFIVGNIIDPKVSGNKLDLSPLTIMISLLFWGFIWGIPGMFLSVPLMLIVKLTFEAIPSLKPLAVFIGSGNEALTKKEDPPDRFVKKIRTFALSRAKRLHFQKRFPFLTLSKKTASEPKASVPNSQTEKRDKDE